MKTNQLQLIHLLSSAIYDKKMEGYDIGRMRWKTVMEDARAHNITGLIYSSANKYGYLIGLGNKNLEQLKRATFVTAVSQIQHIKQVSKVLQLFNEQKIPVIVLKGLVMRELYPNPELRTMGDADILIKRQDMDNAADVLMSLGYTEDSRNGVHIKFVHKAYMPIEVHWALTNTDYFKSKPISENQIWQNVIKVKVGETETLSLSHEDLAVHLCVHMATHSAYGGFGLRQLCDLVLLVEKKGLLIDWSSFVDKVKECGIDKFTQCIFLMCNRLFNMTLPYVCEDMGLNEGLLHHLMDDIYESGVHGRRNLSKMFGSQWAYHSQNNNDLHIIKKFIGLILPPAHGLSGCYSYAKKYRILLPIAWIHHLTCGAFNRNYNLYSKIKFCILTIHMSKKRKKLLKGLELI